MSDEVDRPSLSAWLAQLRCAAGRFKGVGTLEDDESHVSRLLHWHSGQSRLQILRIEVVLGKFECTADALATSGSYDNLARLRRTVSLTPVRYNLFKRAENLIVLPNFAAF